MCTCGPRFFIAYKFLATGKKKDREIERSQDRQKYTSQRNTTLHPGPMKQTEITIAAEETVFMQTLAVLPTISIIFGIKHFDTEIRVFLSSCPKLKFKYKC